MNENRTSTGVFSGNQQNRASTGISTGNQPGLLTTGTNQGNGPSDSMTSSGTRIQTIQTGPPSSDAQLRTARSEGDETKQGKGKKVVVYHKQTYERNVQRTTSSTDPNNLKDTSTGQSVRLIPIAIENPQVHNVQKQVDTQFIDGKHVKIERKNEEVMRESIRREVKAANQ
ncbi:hypothetical protein Y032_0045g1200 [Ancylostoma ceylanicum]|nr:hypothetical protein Y032_0045g1200 [Ancylostoma ceylanicum]